MKLIAIFISCFIFFTLFIHGKIRAQNFNRSTFYSVLSAGKIIDIDQELKALKSESILEKEAYEGVLLMRKAGLVKIPAEKLRFFKTGRIKLETSLIKDSINTEFHFLRLMIQEHAPKIVNYHNDLAKDKSNIIKFYKNLPAVIQQAINNYAKSSKILDRDDLKISAK